MTRGQVRRIVPSYLATGGSGTPTRNTLQSLTALTATGLPSASHHTPAQQRFLDLVGKGSLTIMESAAYLRLPSGVCKMLASQLIDEGHLRASAPQVNRPDRSVLERVLHGLEAL
ncbi:DUF742 domain-containing protein [Streptomyces sp. NPDC002519]|uniref:DUF742 domain-containing protein n=1 Tax=Streptomyces kronopolitis TaxID=1612435 RepID=UPI00341F788E